MFGFDLYNSIIKWLFVWFNIGFETIVIFFYEDGVYTQELAFNPLYTMDPKAKCCLCNFWNNF
jgi:hypothetical protein